MADDDYVEGDAHSEPADAPDTDPAPRGAQGGFDSGSVSDAPVMHRPKSASRMAAARSAFAAAVAASKDTPAKPATGDNDILDPDEPAPTAPIAAKADVVKAKAEAQQPAAAPEPAKPPAPSLDPEIRRQREQLKQERDAIAAERAALAKERESTLGDAGKAPPLPATADIETYLDNAPSAVRAWLETMRADKMTDDEFKSEVADLITMLSGDVLGVPLPENVRMKLDAAQAKKMVKTSRQLQTRREQEASARAEKERAALTEKQETERVEHEWGKAAESLSGQFKHVADAEGKPAESTAMKSYPWLAAEDNPGQAIVDVIRATFTRDGTQLQWQEAAKLANDYLESEAKRYYDKRKPLLGGGVTPAAAKPAVAAKPTEPVAPAAKPAVTTTPSGNQRWNNDKHRENTRAAFRAQLAAKE